MYINKKTFSKKPITPSFFHGLPVALCIGMALILAPCWAETPIASPQQAPASQPLFGAGKVMLGITPTGWVNDDDPSINDNIGYKQIISEMALSGFQGSSVSHTYPTDIKELKFELELRGLKISEPWVGTYFTIKAMKEKNMETFDKQMKFIKAMGGTDIVVAELGNAVHQLPVAVLPNKPEFSEEQWRLLTDGLNQMGKIATENGMNLCYHPHVGTGVEKLPDIERLMKDTKPEYVKLLLDTGHLYYAGVDPLEITKKYATRIKHVHLKNIRKNVLDESVKSNSSFLDSIRAGVFTVPGDPAGAIDFKPILQTLAAAKFEGWLVVEAEQDPKKANPLVYAKMARNYLREILGQ
jgi:inosose dehydratase